MVTPKGGIVKRSNHSKYKKGELTLRYTTEEYVANLKKIIAVLKESSDTLIWANTTPVLRLSEIQEAAYKDKKEAALKLMKKEGVIANDLHKLALPNLKEWQSKDGVHFTKKGYSELAKQVASSISGALGNKKEPANK